MTTLLTKLFFLVAMLFGASESEGQTARVLYTPNAVELDTSGTNIMWCDIQHGNVMRITKLDSFKFGAFQIKGLRDSIRATVDSTKSNLSVVKAGNVYTVSNTHGTGFAFNICDPDSSTTNEIQTLSLTVTKDTLSISGGNTVYFKRVETYSGTTNASGVYTVTFPRAYAVAPNIQANIVNQVNTNQFLRVTSVSTTGFTVNVFARGSLSVLGVDVLLFTTTNVNGAAVDVLITEK